MSRKQPVVSEADVAELGACPRCQGYVVRTWLEGDEGRWRQRVRSRRCVNCGWYAAGPRDASPQQRLWAGDRIGAPPVGVERPGV